MVYVSPLFQTHKALAYLKGILSQPLDDFTILNVFLSEVDYHSNKCHKITVCCEQYVGYWKDE